MAVGFEEDIMVVTVVLVGMATEMGFGVRGVGAA